MGVIKDLNHAGNDKQLCCDKPMPETEVTRAVIEARLRFCEECDCFDMGRCTMMSEPLSLIVRREGAKCPIGVW